MRIALTRFFDGDASDVNAARAMRREKIAAALYALRFGTA
jgi:hypothetical protein